MTVVGTVRDGVLGLEGPVLVATHPDRASLRDAMTDELSSANVGMGMFVLAGRGTWGLILVLGVAMRWRSPARSG